MRIILLKKSIFMDLLDYTIKKHKRAKRISIKISSAGEVSVTIPYYASKKEAERFIFQKKDWITSTLARIESKKPKYTFSKGEKIPFLGGELDLNIIEKDISYPKGIINSELLVIFVPHNQNTKKVIRETIIKTLKKNFRDIVTEAVEEYIQEYGYEYNRIAIKDNKSNWGSCSSKKNLNFNWKLIFAPLDIIDYVVVHEICHLKEQNHSKDFWDLVAKEFPDYKEKEKWLKENASKLII